MATSGGEIKDFILTEMAKYPDDFNVDHATLQKMMECIGNGVYKAMQKLEDNAGDPPATGHS